MLLNFNRRLIKVSACNMKFCHQVRFTRSCYHDVSFRALVVILPRFALLKLSLERCMILTSHKNSIVVVKVLNTFNNLPKFQLVNREN